MPPTATASAAEVPNAARGVIVHWMVLVLLDQTRAAEEGLERELRQYAARGVNDPGCPTGELVPASDPVLGGVLLRVRRRPCTL